MKEISTASVLCVIISALLAVLPPIVFWLVGKLKMKGSLLPILWGFLTYIVSFLLQAVLWTALDMDDVLTRLLGSTDSEVVIKMIKCVFLALVETAVLWAYFRIRKKKDGQSAKAPGSAMVFGTTYAVFAGIMYSYMLILSVIVLLQNAAGNGDVLYSFPFTGKLSVNVSKINNGGTTFLCYGLRSLFDLIFYIASSILLFFCVREETKWQLPVVLLMNIFRNAPAQLGALNVWYWNNNIVTMIAIGVVAVVTALIAYRAYLVYQKRADGRQQPDDGSSRAHAGKTKTAGKVKKNG